MSYFAAYNTNKMYVGVWQQDFAKIVLDNENTCLRTGILMFEFIKAPSTEYLCFQRDILFICTSGQEKIRIVSEANVLSEATF